MAGGSRLNKKVNSSKLLQEDTQLNLLMYNDINYIIYLKNAVLAENLKLFISVLNM